MRRRAIGLSLLALGAVLLGAALAVRLFLVPTMVRLPLDQTGSTTVADQNATWFDQETLEQKNGPVEANVVVQGDPTSEDATDDVAVWVSGTTITDEDGDIVTPPTETVTCLDRHTAESLSCDSARLNGEPADIEGLTVTFPLGTERRDYDVWNSNAGAASTARYVGEEELEGLSVYRFEQDIPEQVIDRREVPASLAGGTESGNVTADVVFSNDRVLYVEPTSGSIVKVTENPVTTLARARRRDRRHRPVRRAGARGRGRGQEGGRGLRHPRPDQARQRNAAPGPAGHRCRARADRAVPGPARRPSHTGSVRVRG